MDKAYRKDDFDFFNQVGKINQRIKSYLENAGFEMWAHVYAPVNRGRTMTSNIAECINGKLKLARELPIIEFLEQARKLFGKWNCKNRERASYTNTSLGSRFEGILQLNTSESSRLKVSDSSTYVYSVYDDGSKYIVCLDRRTCSCGRFQLDEITCEHAIAVLKRKRVVDMKSYCSEFYYPKH
ncbi:uncharacterized protein LOC124898606 [Capsicum annuum]|uniref:uncharacterized protein LOC107872036 n=1 Tax=Capsicum annuum TaxID=4072 RepID=UPI0007BFBFF6|nr:uncharacterized protein LOC107872036 [Capsicum annuum]XP_047257873.1 uncharacterized protein LOC124890023 [Capsicum annuum]XP_047262140.1 uncharacterized protein LOC124895757 [Capsicum annuum]XP_047262143.1 uncharacterized protein LOC124895759 [Capsicum annuum]XP_047268194.1 uncharacterized protein LOC124898604 [Capsicum annuum]XP_047268196.1 uncharacterized protein LOC124898606 [Capsicum annuum]